VEFADGGPHLPRPIRSESDVAGLHVFDPAAEIGFTGKTLARLRTEVGDRAAVLGFAGAPWTLASYLVEGGSSKSFAVIKEMMFREPQTLRALLDLLADAIGDVLSFQIESGAQAVQLFDTWAGELEAADYRAWALPAAARTIARIRRMGCPVILYVNGCGHILEDMAQSGADVLSIDWRVPMDQARGRVPALALQGNLDPATLLGVPEEVARRTREVVRATGGRGHVVNLGHGVLPSSRLECVEAFFAAAREPLPAPAESGR
jgi:uroporphyrinogen decarboxylase